MGHALANTLRRMCDAPCRTANRLARHTASQGEREAAQAKLDRLLDELGAMAASKAEVEKQLFATQAQVAERDEEVRSLTEALEAAKEAAKEAGRGSAAELDEARRKVATLEAEMAAVREELTNAMKDLTTKSVRRVRSASCCAPARAAAQAAPLVARPQDE